MLIHKDAMDIYKSSKGKHLCCSCSHIDEIEYRYPGWAAETTLDPNACKLIQSRYAKDADDPIETIDHGFGYWVTKCKFYKPARKLTTAIKEPCRQDESKKPDYYEYINSPEWKAKREERLKHDKYQCQLCHTAKNLVVHHVSYDRLGHEDLSDLVTLCKKCHESVHQKDLENK